MRRHAPAAPVVLQTNSGSCLEGRGLPIAMMPASHLRAVGRRWCISFVLTWRPSNAALARIEVIAECYAVASFAHAEDLPRLAVAHVMRRKDLTATLNEAQRIILATVALVKESNDVTSPAPTTRAARDSSPSHVCTTFLDRTLLTASSRTPSSERCPASTLMDKIRPWAYHDDPDADVPTPACPVKPLLAPHCRTAHGYAGDGFGGGAT